MSDPHQPLTVADRVMLLVNALNAGDPIPVCKLFTPGGRSAWIVVSVDPEDLDRMFGLCRGSAGALEVGYFRLSEIRGLAEAAGHLLKRDDKFRPDKPFSAYVDDARAVREHHASPALAGKSD